MGRLPYEVTESELRREFEIYGPLERIRLVRNKDGKSRGYAFLIYDRERDMKGECRFCWRARLATRLLAASS